VVPSTFKTQGGKAMRKILQFEQTLRLEKVGTIVVNSVEYLLEGGLP